MIRFETDRLILRKYIMDDLPAAPEYFLNEEVSHCEDFWPVTAEVVREMIS